ncbi:MAG: phosphosulfolactate synthase [Thaumarchaeota archaeon]|nr:phosphosulfolactate synthase [Nitrososphaerota archaeon]
MSRIGIEMLTERFLGDIFPSRQAKPRSKGITMVLDRLQGTDKGEFEALAECVDVVKIGWGLSTLLSEEKLASRIGFYHRNSVRVSTGGTLLEIAVTKGKATEMIRVSRKVGFDIIEVSEGITDLGEKKQDLVAEILSNGLDFVIEVGKKDPKNQLSLEETIAGVQKAQDLGSKYVILEGRESGKSVGIYDENGSIKWNWVEAIVNKFPYDQLMFEAPLEEQQAALIVHFGAGVDLGNVSFASIGALETQRQQLRGDTFGMIKASRNIQGSPATKFVYHLIQSNKFLDQTAIIQLSGLPRRTVQSSLDSLVAQNAIKESRDPNDTRRRVYTLV